MLSLTHRDAVTAALTDTTLDPDLRALIGLRVWQVDTDRGRLLGEILQIVVVHPGDPPEVIHDAVGFPICWDQAEQPGWEWMNDHGSWFELCYVLTDDFGMLVFVADHPETNHTLRFNCLGVTMESPAEQAGPIPSSEADSMLPADGERTIEKPAQSGGLEASPKEDIQPSKAEREPSDLDGLY